MNGRNLATGIILSALGLCAAAPGVLAGDGSGTSNPGLLRGTYPALCAAPSSCPPGQQAAQPLMPQTPMQAPLRLTHASSPSSTLPRPVPLGTGPGNCEVLRAGNIYSAECESGLAGRAAAPSPDVSAQTTLSPPAAAAQPAALALPTRLKMPSTAASEPIELEPPVEPAGGGPRPQAQGPGMSPMVTGSISEPVAGSVSQSVMNAAIAQARAVAPRQFFTGGVGQSGLVDDAVKASWSVSLRGGYVEDAEGGHFEASLLPYGSISALSGRGDITLRTSADLSEQIGGRFRINEAEIGIEGTRQLNSLTELSGDLRLSLSQDRPETADNGIGTIQPPLILTGSAEAGVERTFGRLQVGLSASALREVVGTTRASDGSETDNTYRNRTGYGFGARAEYELTPILSVFEQLQADREAYDLPSASLGALEDNWTYSARTGISAAWRGGLSAEASVGYALRRFDDSALNDEGSMIYGASVAYAPSGRLTLATEFESGISSSEDVQGATAKFSNDLELKVSYLASDWLMTRASASAGWASYAGTSTTESGYAFGVGADFLLNSYLSLAADYSYRSSNSSSGTTDHAHRVTAGVTVSRLPVVGTLSY